jgi:glycosyltransferase involved in cell wall biosynthesis
MGNKIAKPLLSVVIPAYNEDQIIEYTIADIKKELKKIKVPYEIVVIDDASTDLTGRIAAMFGARVLKTERNVGLGRALIAGFGVAQGEIIVMIDADGAYNPEEIEKLIEPIMKGEADFVYGTRFVATSDIRPYSMSLLHYVGSKMLSFSLRLLTGLPLSDSLSSFKAISKEALKKLDLNLQTQDIDLEMSNKAVRKGLRIAEVPITFRARPRSIEPSFWDGFRILRRILRSSLYG